MACVREHRINADLKPTCQGVVPVIGLTIGMPGRRTSARGCNGLSKGKEVYVFL